MDYNKIILELLDRIKVLEEKVEKLEKNQFTHSEENQSFNEFDYSRQNMSLVQRARNYIDKCKRIALETGNNNIILRCNDIQKDLNVSNRAASICQAMYDCMLPMDEVIEAPQSGKSTTVTINYHLDNFISTNENSRKDNELVLDAKEAKSISIRQLKTGFEYYFKNKKPEYKQPGPLFGMAFFITRHDIGVNLQDMISGKVSLDEYGSIMYDYFYSLKPETAKERTSAYKDAMKNFLEYIEYMHFENITLEN